MISPSILLASNSPRRRQLLSLTGWEFTVRPVEIDETPQPDETPEDYVTRLAQTKARSAAQTAPAGWLVLGADTTVADGSLILGKPADAAEAREMLLRLRGKEHRVCTAIAIVDPASGAISSNLCVTQVPMRDYSDAEVEAYVATGDPLDKAGAYAIQHAEFHPVERLQGCYASVMGLPLCHLMVTLRQLGLSPAQDVPQACQASLDYACPIHAAVLSGERVG
jgi:MAF protein